MMLRSACVCMCVYVGFESALCHHLLPDFTSPGASVEQMHVYPPVCRALTPSVCIPPPGRLSVSLPKLRRECLFWTRGCRWSDQVDSLLSCDCHWFPSVLRTNRTICCRQRQLGVVSKARAERAGELETVYRGVCHLCGKGCFLGGFESVCVCESSSSFIQVMIQ